jgi:putative DNA primase/helicase
VKPPDKKTTPKNITVRLSGENRTDRGQASEEDVASAINSIDPDCDYQTWIEVGQALHAWDSERGFVLLNEWSSKGSKYKVGECQSKWDGFKAGGGITIGTLFHHAKAAGWKPDIADFSLGNPVKSAKAGIPWPMTDAGNAERLAHYMRDNLVFDERMQCWRYFNGKKWEVDNGKYIYRGAVKVVRKIRYEEARQCPNEDMEKKLWSHSVASESRSSLAAMIALAQFMPGVSQAEFDADKYLFNCQNGTIELKTGTLREHRADDFITRISPVAYDPSADCSIWTKFLDETLHGDQEMLRFIKKSAGYCLSGDTSEEILFLVHGPAATGKSTYMEAVKSVLGDYSKTCDFETFLKQKDSGRPRNDLAGLAGARLVSSCEVEEGKALAESIIKNITGGDTISTRFLYKEFFEYEPQFKLWLVCNHAPKVDPQDDAMWRRILRIPFIFIVPKGKRDKKLKPMLKDPTIGGKQILKWAVEGFLLWQVDGLQIPETVVQATEEYRKSCDYLSDFFAEVCDVSDPLAWMSTAQLFDAYKKYCDANEIKHTMNMVSFSRKLESRGLKKQKQGGIRGWQGICPASKVPVLDRLDTSSTKFSIEPPHMGLCKTSVQSVPSVQPTATNATSEQSDHTGLTHPLAGFAPPPTITPRPTGFAPPPTITPRPTGFAPPPTITPRPTGFAPPPTITPTIKHISDDSWLTRGGEK